MFFIPNKEINLDRKTYQSSAIIINIIILFLSTTVQKAHRKHIKTIKEKLFNSYNQKVLSSNENVQ